MAAEPTTRIARRRLALGLSLGVFTVAIAGGVAGAFEDGPARQLMPRQVERIEADLHEIGRVCVAKARTRPTAGDQRLLGRIARTFVRLYRDYPDARFRIDDEGAGMLSVLLVARVDLRACSPPAAAILDRALPTRFRAVG